MRKLLLVLAIAVSVNAQTVPAHKATLTWQESVNADVYRGDGTCDAAASFAKTAVNVPSGYADTAVVGGTTYCYYVIEQPSNIPSNLLEVTMPTDALVAIKAAKQTAGAAAQ